MATASLVRNSVDTALEVTSQGQKIVTVMFAATAFSGAALLFLVEPMVAKLLLPLYGGSATVWSTSTLFFQVLLLVAYAYCHGSTRWLARRFQPGTHVLLLLLPLLVLPLAVPADAAPGEASPTLWLLRTLVLLVGLPFLILGTTGPLLQRWYSWTDSTRAEDPYFLFAASNLGSFVGLLAYPLLVEPQLSLAQQRASWSAAYVVFLILTSACGACVWFQSPRASRLNQRSVSASAVTPRPTRATLAMWAALAFLPSTLMLGVTSHISTDVAAIPLLWVVPLAIYLATFVAAFARRSRQVPVLVARSAVALALMAIVVALVGSTFSVYVSVGTSLAMLAGVAYVCHLRLAVDRPATEHLTGFYMIIAAGGALGGVLNGLVAPLLFPSVLEYRLAFALAPFLLLGLRSSRHAPLTRRMETNPVRAGVMLILAALAAVALRLGLSTSDAGPWSFWGIVAVFMAVAWILTEHFALVLAAVLALLATNIAAERQDLLEESRTFYGTYRVLGSEDKHTLVHGTTVHGTQFTASHLRRVPTTYYSRSGPLGEIFELARSHDFASIAAVGMGVGTVAAYGLPGQSITFFEVDPEVVRIARDPRFFSYVSDSRASVHTVVGDGRLSMAAQPAHKFDLQILDAFSSDSIPVHLLTREAVSEYVQRLAPGGIMVFHITNRTFDLQPVLSAAASALHLEAAVGTGRGAEDGSTSSRWIALSADEAIMNELVSSQDWASLRGDEHVKWSDDYSSVLTALK